MTMKASSSLTKFSGANSRSHVAKVLDCDIILSEFEFQSRHHVHFRTNVLGNGSRPFISPAIDQILCIMATNLGEEKSLDSRYTLL